MNSWRDYGNKCPNTNRLLPTLVCRVGITQLLSSEQQRVIVNILLGFGFLVPCGGLLGIFLYDKYCTYRSAVLKEQIELLERLWQQMSQH